jgi:hypothetical protein
VLFLLHSICQQAPYQHPACFPTLHPRRQAKQRILHSGVSSLAWTGPRLYILRHLAIQITPSGSSVQELNFVSPSFYLSCFFLLFGLAFCAVLFFSFSNAWWDFGVPWTSAIGRTQGKWRLMFSRMIWDESKAAKGVGRPKRMFDG